MADGKIITAIITGVVALAGSGGGLAMILRRHQQELDDKVPFTLHEEMCGKLKEEVGGVKEQVGEVMTALQGETGETGLVADIAIMARTIGEIREHQKNGGG